jgi:hypothetical protein
MASLIADQDIIVDKGRLGTLTRFTNVTSTISLVPGVNVAGIGRYTSNYLIDTNLSVTDVTLPSPSDVSIGWGCKINVGLLPVSLPSIINIYDHLGNIVFIFYNVLTTSPATAGSTRVTYTSANFILRDSNTWIIEPNLPQTTFRTSSLIFNSLGYPVYLSRSLIGNATLNASASGNNVNRLFSDNTAIIFGISGGGIIDPNFYSYNDSTTIITFNRKGSYDLNAILQITNTGGALSSGLQFKLVRSGVDIPFYCNYSPVTTQYPYSIKAKMHMDVGDTMSIIAGRLATTAGTTVVGLESNFNIKFLG